MVLLRLHFQNVTVVYQNNTKNKYSATCYKRGGEPAQLHQSAPALHILKSSSKHSLSTSNMGDTLKKSMTMAQVGALSELVWGEKKVLLNSLLDCKQGNYRTLSKMDKLFSHLLGQAKRKSELGGDNSLLYSALSELEACEAAVSPTLWANWTDMPWNKEEDEETEEIPQEDSENESERHPEEKGEEAPAEGKKEARSSSDSSDTDSDEEPSDKKGMKIPVVCSGQTTKKLPQILGGSPSPFRDIRDKGEPEKLASPTDLLISSDSEDDSPLLPPATPTYSPRGASSLKKYTIPKKPVSVPELPSSTVRSLYKEGKPSNFAIFFLTLAPPQKEHPCHQPAISFLT